MNIRQAMIELHALNVIIALVAKGEADPKDIKWDNLDNKLMEARKAIQGII